MPYRLNRFNMQYFSTFKQHTMSPAWTISCLLYKIETCQLPCNIWFILSCFKMHHFNWLLTANFQVLFKGIVVYLKVLHCLQSYLICSLIHWFMNSIMITMTSYLSAYSLPMMDFYSVKHFLSLRSSWLLLRDGQRKMEWHTMCLSVELYV